MDNFNLFLTLMMADVSHFLSSEPYVWFVGLAIIAFIAKILSSFIRGSVGSIK